MTLTRSAHTRVTQCSSPSGRLSVSVGASRRRDLRAFRGPCRCRPRTARADTDAPPRRTGSARTTRVSSVAARLGVGGEAVCGQRVGDRRDRGLDRTVPFGRFHARRDRAAVVVADLLGQRAGLVDRQPFERAGQQRGQQIVALGRERKVRVARRRRGSASTAGPPTTCRARARRRGSCPPRASRGGGGRRSGAARSARRPRRPSRRRSKRPARTGRCRAGSGRRRRW